MNIVLATCAMWPGLSAGDTPLADELARRGHEVAAHAWNDSPLSSFVDADLVVLRSNWDFHHDLETFDHWLDAVASRTRVENAAALVTAHNHKSYLLRYADAGVPTPATTVLPSFDSAAIEQWMVDRTLDRVVCKPAWGASGHRVELLERDSLAEVEGRWNDDGDAREVVIQEFVPDITDGELAMVLFGGRFSHALRRMPSSDDFRVNSQYGGQMMLEEEVDPSAIAFARDVMNTIQPTPTYARIDIVRSGERYLLMEVELNEPALGLHLAPGSAALFADALLS